MLAGRHCARRRDVPQSQSQPQHRATQLGLRDRGSDDDDDAMGVVVGRDDGSVAGWSVDEAVLSGSTW